MLALTSQRSRAPHLFRKKNPLRIFFTCRIKFSIFFFLSAIVAKVSVILAWAIHCDLGWLLLAKQLVDDIRHINKGL